jgi:ATP:corrinoid adenosyltransferase
MVVVFGRPGAGKSTIAHRAVQKAAAAAATSIRQNIDINTSDDTKNVTTTTTHAVSAVTTTATTVIGIDLDVYVPQWMKDNFAAGIYPNLQQRQDFAHVMCQSLQEELWLHKQQQQELQNASSTLSAAVTSSDNNKSDDSMVQQVAAIVSFSFVNNDLRDIFRCHFPAASWVLLDTTEQEAQRRIRERTGHFYKGSPDEITITTTSATSTKATATATTTKPPEGGESGQSSTSSAADNADWKFGAVTFQHVILNGNDPIDTNADIVIQTLCSILERHRLVADQPS